MGRHVIFNVLCAELNSFNFDFTSVIGDVFLICSESCVQIEICILCCQAGK